METERADLLTVSINGGNSIVINSPPLNRIGSAIVADFIESPSSEYVIYVAFRPQLELFSVRLSVEEQNDAELCFPIISKNDVISIVCL